MNNDLISRSELKKAIKEEICNFELPISANEIISIIDKAPTVDARPQGEWLPKTSFDGYFYWRCDRCRVDVDETTDYCPHCGAKMKGG